MNWWWCPHCERHVPDTCLAFNEKDASRIEVHDYCQTIVILNKDHVEETADD